MTHWGLCPLGLGVGVSVHGWWRQWKDRGDHFQESERCLGFFLTLPIVTVLSPCFCHISEVLKYHHFGIEILFRMERWWWMCCPWFQFTPLNACYSKLHNPFRFEYFCFLHPLLTWFYKSLQNKYPEMSRKLCVKHRRFAQVLGCQMSTKNNNKIRGHLQVTKQLRLMILSVSVMALHCCQDEESNSIPLLLVQKLFHTSGQLSLPLHSFPILPQRRLLWTLQAATWVFLSPVPWFFRGSFPSPTSVVSSKPSQLPFR